ncbi:hypothetical protein [Alkalihalobacillus sp. LMS39]|uniref:hypothetical protein n=1 Tax=Alkalihalobacillus sp. LMS39 TaxID=2924032 RepID=UPI001FB49F3D|nr:hypothetical protein [Alkalihalobacillus sp. LMS39]UOE96442.1 hypothetical protein MM271_14155 [Alkalihalobacillus sp. LMS39]
MYVKLINKSLVTNEDIEFNKKMGLPVEVFCPREYKTLAFGRIQSFCNEEILINGHPYCRENNAFFGHPSVSA